MTHNEAIKRNIRNEPWAANAPEWLIEVIAQITENREENQKVLAVATELMQRLEQMEQRLSNGSAVLQGKEEALVKAVTDLKDFANTIYGPESAVSQINAKLDNIQVTLANERKANEQRFKELELARDENDEWRKECEARMDDFERQLADILRRSA